MGIRSRLFKGTAIASICLLTNAQLARAGMPSATLTDIAAARLQTISFFLMVFLASSLVVKLLWNWLRRDFPILPKISYPRALALVALWGFLFTLVLTMISGARELLTPGAWERDGAVYRLTTSATTQPTRNLLENLEIQRHARLEDLKAALWMYAMQHEGQLPADDRAPEIAANLWETSDPSRARFIYVPGRRPGVARDPLAYEPSIAFGSLRWVLLSDGDILQMNDADIRSALKSGGK